MDPIDNHRPLATTVPRWILAHAAHLIAALALATVAAVAGTVSYTHIDWLTLVLGGSRMVAHIMAFAVDGQILMGSVVLLVARGRQAWWGWLGIVPGLAESLFANWEAGIPHGLLAAGWYTVPAQAFAVASFLFERLVRALVTGAYQGGTPNILAGMTDIDGGNPNGCPHRIAGTADEAIVQAFLHARDCLDAPLSQRQLSTAFSVRRPRVAELVGPFAIPEPEPSLNGSAPGA